MSSNRPVGIIIDSEADLNADWKEGTLVRCLDTGKEYQLLEGAFVRCYPFVGTKSNVITTDGSGAYSVSFVTPFKTTNYSVALTCEDIGAMVGAFKFNKTVNGFDIITRDKNGHTKPNVTVSWLATVDFNE